MNIVVLTGSPHKNGTSALLAEQFIKGAKEAGHDIYRFDAAFRKVHPCIACDHCAKDVCVFQDDMVELSPKLLASDMIVFATPIYYFSFSAQLKMVIDRFYAYNQELIDAKKKAVLLATGGDEDAWSFDVIANLYHNLCKYLCLEDQGMVLAQNTFTREMIEQTTYPKQAYELGKALK